MDRQFRRDFSIFDDDDFFYNPMPKYAPLLENSFYQPRMTISQQKLRQPKQENQTEQYYYSSNTGEVNGIKIGNSVEAKTKLINGKLVKNVKKTKYNEDGTKDVQEFIEDENGYRVNNFQLDKPAQQQQLANEMVDENKQQLQEPPCFVKRSSSQQLQKHEDPFKNMGSFFKDFDQDFSINPFQGLNMQKSLSLFDKNDFFGQNQFFEKEIDNWFKEDDFFKFPKLNWGQTQNQPEEQPATNQQKYTIRQFQTVKDGNKTGHIIEKQERNENGKVSRQVKNVKLNTDGTKDVHEIVENQNGKIENIQKLNKDNQEIAQIKNLDDVIIEDEKEIMNN